MATQATAHAYCKDKVAKSGSSFYYSFLFLPREKYEAIVAVYAFCREVDDIVDECTELSIAQAKLAWWQEEIESLFAERPTHPITQALLPHLKTHRLHKHLFLEIINGMAMDLQYQGYATYDDLRVYCHCVASAVGLLACSIFGYTDDSTLEYAKNLGVALQLINIIRDVGEDAGRGRVYLPEEDLAQFQLDTQELLQRQNSDRLQACLAFQAQRARAVYQQALNALSLADSHHQRPGLIMAAIYVALLKEIEKSKFDVLHQRISLTPIRKLWIAWKTARKYKAVRVNLARL